MMKPFSMATALRMVPNALLREFFVKLGHEAFDPNWATLGEWDVNPILVYVTSLERDRLDAVESGLRSVSELASDGGLNALFEAGAACGFPHLGAMAPDDLSVWGRVMWIWLHHRPVFDRAQIIYQVEHMSWWRKRNDLPQNAPDVSRAAIAELERSISGQLRPQGRGKACTVELMSRGLVHYFFAYPDDFAENVLVHDQAGRLSPEVFRQTLLIVFAYHEADGSLETYAKKLDKATKERLEVAFADAVLHWELDAYDPAAAFELDQLKDPDFELTTDPADRLHVRLRKLRLSSPRTGRRLTIEVDDNRAEDIHRAMEECLNLDDCPLSEWRAVQATFCFEFLPLEGRKAGKQTFDVGVPRSCSLRNARPERVELIQKYLKRWRIDRALPTQPAPLSVGA